MSELDIVNIINVSVSEAPVGISDYKVNNVALFTNEAPVSGTYGYKGIYTSPADVATDFGSSSEAYLQANALFSQNPNILTGGGRLIIFPLLPIGAITVSAINAAGSGYTVGDILTVTQSGGTYGSFTVTEVNSSGGVTKVTAYNPGAGYTAATGLPTTVSPAGGTSCTIDITTVQAAAETLSDGIIRCRTLEFFVGILSNNHPTSTARKTLADLIEGYKDKTYFLPSNIIADIAGDFTTIKTASDFHTRCLYYGGTAQQARLFAAAAAGRGMCVNFDGSRTTNTLHMKSLTGITPDSTVSQTVLTALTTAGVDAYVDIAGISMYWSNGANRYFDEVFNLIWFVSQLKVNGFNALRELSTKIPQTEAGMSLLKGAYRQACEQGVSNGMIAPGSWTSSEYFGNPEDFYNNVEERGYYIYSQPIVLQSSSDRIARKAPLVQIAIKYAGALHSSDVIVNFNR